MRSALRLFPLILLLLVLFPARLRAATIYWNGAGANNNWSTAANWSGSTLPTAADAVVFNTTSTKNATVDATVKLSAIRITTGYTGTISLASNVTVSVGSLAVGSTSATVRMGTGSKLTLLGSGTPLTGSGTVDTATYTPNTVEYVGQGVTNITAAGPLTAYHNLTLTGTGMTATDIALTGASRVRSGVTYGGFAYYGTWEGTVVKVRLSDFTSVGTLTPSGMGIVRDLVMDGSRGFLYAAGHNSPIIIAKINLSSFTVSSTLTVPTSTYLSFYAAFDSTNNLAYYPSFSTPINISKINFDTFSFVSTVNFSGATICGNCGSTPYLDPTGTYVYEDISATPKQIAKVRTSDMVQTSYAVLDSGEGVAGFDFTNGYLYTALSGGVSKRQLSDLTRVASLSLDAGSTPGSANQTALGTSVGYAGQGSVGAIANFDTAAGFLYATQPSTFSKVRLSDLSRVASLSFDSSDRPSGTLLTDNDGYGFTGAHTENPFVRFHPGWQRDACNR